MKISRRPLFIVDIEECAEYLDREAGEEVARRWRDTLAQTIKLLAKSPEIGRIRRDLPLAGIRSFLLKQF